MGFFPPFYQFSALAMLAFGDQILTAKPKGQIKRPFPAQQMDPCSWRPLFSGHHVLNDLKKQGRSGEIDQTTTQPDNGVL
jgi:hypothetical protein